MKGISPLIASVILIAVTLAIAGVLATWATTFVSRTTVSIETQEACRGALRFTVPPTYANGNITLSYFNTKPISLTNLTVIYTLTSGWVNQTVLGTLGPSPASDFKTLTGITSKPINLKIISMNCGDVLLADTPVA